MGAIFDAMNLRLAINLQDVQANGASITTATQDGKKRTSLQRSRDVMDGRYFVQSILRLVDREMYHGIQTNISFDADGFLDITAYDVVNHRAIDLTETTVRYNKPVKVVAGDELPIYRKLLVTSRPLDLVAAVVSDNSSATRMTRLRLLKGSDVSSAFNTFSFDVGYYSVPKLTELVAGAITDVTEPRVWHPLIEKYALATAWQASGNSKRYDDDLKVAYRLALLLVRNEFGQEAASKVASFLGEQ